jgi:alpha-ketoglutarate-dependent 2,4-dichlorophenoxyacetate dioxygenase
VAATLDRRCKFPPEFLADGLARTVTLAVQPLHPIFAAEITGTDLTQAPDDTLVRAVEDAMAQYAVCVVRDASTSDDDHIRFSRAFGPLELPPKMGRFNAARRLRCELFDASNLDANGEIVPYHSEARRIARGAERFHTDSSFNRLPTKWSLLLGHIVPPEGGDTHFIDTRAVCDALPQELCDRIENLVGIHDFWRARERTSGLTNITPEQRASLPPVMHRLVRMMPYGRKSLYIGGHAVGIVGWPEEEGLALLDELYAFATHDRFIYVHKWRPADLVIWDNRCSLHRATPLEDDRYKRDVRRTTINEFGPETSADAEAA